MESVSGDYEDYDQWALLEHVFNDTNIESGNVLAAYIREKRLPSHAEAAKEVAKMLGDPFEKAFPFHAEVLKSRKKPGKKPSNVVVEAEIPESCKDCDNISKFVAVTTFDQYLFEEGEVYAEAQCMNCKKWFATPANQKVPERGQEQLELPSDNNVAHACGGMQSQRCRCGNFICAACFGCNGRRRRRSSTS